MATSASSRSAGQAAGAGRSARRRHLAREVGERGRAGAPWQCGFDRGCWRRPPTFQRAPGAAAAGMIVRSERPSSSVRPRTGLPRAESEREAGRGSFSQQYQWLNETGDSRRRRPHHRSATAAAPSSRLERVAPIAGAVASSSGMIRRGARHRQGIKRTIPPWRHRPAAAAPARRRVRVGLLAADLAREVGERGRAGAPWQCGFDRGCWRRPPTSARPAPRRPA